MGLAEKCTLCFYMLCLRRIVMPHTNANTNSNYNTNLNPNCALIN